jgi:hypothetical protein
MELGWGSCKMVLVASGSEDKRHGTPEALSLLEGFLCQAYSQLPGEGPLL